MRKVWIAGLAALTLAGLAGAAASQDMAAVAKARHEHFKTIGAAMKAISDQLKSANPSVPEVQKYARQLDDLAPQIPNWFPAGSGPDAGIKTHAKADIWKRPDEFKHDAAALATEAHKLDVAAAGGDMAAVGAQLKVVGQACGTCHKAFREKED